MNRPLACIFEGNEMGNKELTWSGLIIYNLISTLPLGKEFSRVFVVA